MDGLKVSVIVPVYKVQDYIEECLQSILSQTYTNIEVLCVNDGSPDKSPEIIQRIAATDSRVTLIDQQNQGLSAARNTGIHAATGDILCFVDSDDLIEPNTCACIVNEFSKSEVNAVVFGGTCFPLDAAPRWDVQHLSPRRAWYPAFEPRLIFDEMSTPYAVRVALRRDAFLACGVLFDSSLKYGEDELFLFSLYPRISGVQLISDKLYRYRMAREGSLTASSVHQAKDPARSVSDNITIAERIFLNWAEGGFLDRYASELVTWSVKFVGYGAFCQQSADRNSLAARIHHLWNSTLGDATVKKCDLAPHVRSMADAICSFDVSGESSIDDAALRKIARKYRIQEYGWNDLFRTVWEKVRSKLSGC